MHSAEPFEPSVNHPIPPIAPPPSEGKAWRAEVASRVHSYRTRQKNRGAEQQSLGFLPQHAESTQVATSRTADSAPEASHTEGAEIARERISQRKPNESEPGAFDTNYYRRLNALEQSAQAEACVDPAAVEDHAQSELEAEPLPECPSPTIHAARDLAVDLELHAPAAGEAGLDRYRIRGDAEPGAASPGAIAAAHHPSTPTAGALGAQVQTADPRIDHVAFSQTSLSATAPAPADSGAHRSLRVFPRPLLEPPLWAQPSRDELADPVSRPRILEVPEEIMPAVQGSLFPEIRLDAEEPEPSARREPEIAIPLPVAPLKTRLTAGLADLAVVSSGGALFAAIAGRAMPELDAKPFSLVIAAATVLLWAAYQQMFLLYAGRTPGMRIAGIRLSTFDGRTPKWRERRSRARYILISCASVALGFLWALVDQDTLCWHDRASQTFPTIG